MFLGSIRVARDLTTIAKLTTRVPHSLTVPSLASEYAQCVTRSVFTYDSPRPNSTQQVVDLDSTALTVLQRGISHEIYLSCKDKIVLPKMHAQDSPDYSVVCMPVVTKHLRAALFVHTNVYSCIQNTKSASQHNGNMILDCELLHLTLKSILRYRLSCAEG
ncbi:hypothetical protein BDV39DRAFT_183896 [Aspergillus sergii]|uniref:Uncharacterized protein n=1 Tax=Aspergillus sergii TaxID=1034303 RepID=A0A5N6WPI0_9EURO|nr:hypothetical protein BDV39DRAFT_183896 [Aspergillus sergii]